jgi:uncharacterized OB-fold protein
MAVLPEIGCSSCNTRVMPSDNFCPNCGRPLRTTPPATCLSRQIVVYLISFFLAPFGLWYAWKYIKQGDEKSKMIGVIAIALTVAAVALTIWMTKGLVNSVDRSLHALHDLGL